jgi:hypothetical protein
LPAGYDFEQHGISFKIYTGAGNCSISGGGLGSRHGKRREHPIGRSSEINPRETIISVRTPVREGDVFKGLLVSGVTVNALSRFNAQSGALPLADNRFILYGKDHVLAHRLMEHGNFERQPDIPLPTLDQVGDPILAKLWHTEDRRRLLIDLDRDTKGHGIRIDGDCRAQLRPCDPP